MHSRRTHWSRFSALLSLLLHLMLVGVGPVVDASLEADAAALESTRAHVEDANDPHCDTGHHHQYCLIRALQLLDAPPGDAAQAVLLAVSSVRPPSAPVTAPAAATAVSSLGPRAPPAA